MEKQRITKIGKGETLRRFFRHIRNHTYILKTDSHLILCAVITGTPYSKAEIEVRLEGDDARVDIIAIYVGKANDQQHLRVFVRHIGLRTISRIWGRSILFEKARSDTRGMCEIQKTAVQADTYFSHHALLLSPHARALAIPSLEILADDVKAGHAATVGPFAQESLIYLESRGISFEVAKKLLVNGFLAADIAKIPERTMQKKMERLVSTLFHV